VPFTFPRKALQILLGQPKVRFWFTRPVTSCPAFPLVFANAVLLQCFFPRLVYTTPAVWVLLFSTCPCRGPVFQPHPLPFPLTIVLGLGRSRFFCSLRLKWGRGPPFFLDPVSLLRRFLFPPTPGAVSPSDNVRARTFLFRDAGVYTRPPGPLSPPSPAGRPLSPGSKVPPPFKRVFLFLGQHGQLFLLFESSSHGYLQTILPRG